MTYEKHLEKQVAQLARSYQDLQKELADILSSGERYTAAEKDALIKSVSDRLEAQKAFNDEWVNQNIRTEYKKSARDAVRFINTVDDIPINYAFTQVDQEAVNALISEVNLYMQEGLAGSYRDSLRIIDNATRIRAQLLIAEGRLTGDSLKQIRDAIASDLIKNGVSALTDKAGRKWKVEVYAENLARTKMVDAANTGLHNQLLGHGFDLVRVTDHSGECKLCRPWERKVLSITGKTKTLNGEVIKSVAEAKEAGLFHNNCKHRTVPYHPRFAQASERWSNGRYNPPKKG